MSDSNRKANIRSSKFNWIIMVAVNTLIAVMILTMCLLYIDNQNDLRYKNKENGFTTALDAMGQTAYFSLHNEQVYVDNWSTYINTRYMEMDPVINFLGNVNTDTNRVMVQIIDYQTLEGVYITKGTDGVVNTTPISYAGFSDRVDDALLETLKCTKLSSHLHVTLPFTNPVDGQEVLGFCHNIQVQNGDGNTDNYTNYALVRILQVSDFYGKWLPPSYSRARLALVDHNGEFIVHFNKLDGSKSQIEETNLFDHLKSDTKMKEEDIESLRNKFATILTKPLSGDNFNGEIKTRIELNGKGGYYSYHRLQPDEEWAIVGFILRDDLGVIPVDTTVVIIIIIGMFLLIAVDGTFMIIANRRLRSSLKEVKYANEAKTRFLSSMSHDIRTPMNAIIGMTTIAAKRIDDKQQVEECLKQITRASNHLLTLINDVLDISKVESGKFSLNPSVFSLAELMGNIISITQPHIKEKEMDFEIHARNIKYEYIFADELRLNQILINLISNAIKYTPEKGKVFIGIEEQPSEEGQNVTRIIFTISDTGIGISEEFMKTMYETFTRDVDSRINTIQGAGLGLAITKQMVDLMNGTIDVESKVGEGTKFIVTLDLPIADKMTDDLILPPLKVLVVDDDILFLESAEDTLKSLGLETETASSGVEAVEKVELRHVNNNDYQCVIVDWKMPDMSGLDTIRAIRKRVGEDVSLIIISAYDWTDIEAEAIKAGANGFIAKPLFRSSVYNKLNELFKCNETESVVTETNDEDLHGLHLLIAEDNDVNWEIIQVMLEFHGITCERASNGKICVEKMNSANDGEFDAILMDIQMPIMNGKDATVDIRRSNRDYVKNIPIIAMTADAFVEDIAACKEVGMDGHVAKPIDMQKLIKELRLAIESRK